MAGVKGRSGAAATLALTSALSLTSCAALRPPVEPLSQVEFARPESAKRLVVLLPGRRSKPEAFDRYGFVAALQAARPDTAIVAVDSHLGYFRARTIRERLFQDVLEPARERYDEVWLVGTSLGGLGALSMTVFRPEMVTGVVLLAPYLGPEALLEEIEASGGAELWEPSDPDDLISRLWSLVRDQQAVGGGPEMYLGFGQSDRLAPAARQLAQLLPEDRVVEIPGGHRWPIWLDLFEALMTRGALASPGS